MNTNDSEQSSQENIESTAETTTSPDGSTLTTETATRRTEIIDAPLDSGESQTIVIQHSSLALSRLIGWSLAWIGWIAVLVCVGLIFYLWSGRNEYYDTTGGVTESFYLGDGYASDKVAIITISGLIFDGDGYVRQQINRIRQDDRVKAVVIRVDSPGGTVAGSDYMFHHLAKLRDERKLPMVVSMGSMAASGGYYVSMAVGDQSDTIFAEPTTTTGSIGVIIPHYDISGLLERFDIKNDSIVSGPHKQMLSTSKPIGDVDRQKLQDHVDELFAMFKSRIKKGRPYFQKNSSELDALATGEIFTAQKAKDLKLVDKIGFIEDAIKRASELAGLEKGKFRVVKYRQPEPLINLDMGFASSRHAELELLFELSVPRAYFLATSLPPLITSRRTK